MSVAEEMHRQGEQQCVELLGAIEMRLLEPHVPPARACAEPLREQLTEARELARRWCAGGRRDTAASMLDRALEALGRGENRRTRRLVSGARHVLGLPYPSTKGRN